MKKYIVLSEKKWNKDLRDRLAEAFPTDTWLHINKKEDFNEQLLGEYQPDKIFIPHWSYIIPSSIFQNYECIVFHMTDLPYGRGGSPLQNLIANGHKETKVSALRVVKELDAGPIYVKKKLTLEGTAEEIFFRVNEVVFEGVCDIINQDIKPQEQVGDITTFKRRTPEMSNLVDVQTVEKFYDMIRMLDAEGYPHAYLETDTFKIEFVNAQKESDKQLLANVRIIKK